MKFIKMKAKVMIVAKQKQEIYVHIDQSELFKADGHI